MSDAIDLTDARIAPLAGAGTGLVVPAGRTSLPVTRDVATTLAVLKGAGSLEARGLAWRGALIGGIALLRATELRTLWRRMSAHEKRALDNEWSWWAHDGQLPPSGAWRVWVIQAGRGFGKTRAGAEWVSEIARSTPGARIALVGATLDEVRRVMIEGESGLLATAGADEAVCWTRGAGELRFASGATAYVYSADRPETLRGPQHHVAWCDELAKWRYGEAAWDNLVLGVRLGDFPRVLVTTTPRPVNLMRRVVAGGGVTVTAGATYDNPHLPASFVASMEDLYGGSRFGRQELAGELIEDVEGALWTRATIERCRVDAAPALTRVVVAVDPPAGTASGEGDACGIVCVGLGEDKAGYVIEDATVSGLSPEGWARAVAACAARHGADRVVAEKNQGGEMVRSVLRAADAGLPITLVHASRGKVARAEPVAALYETGRVRHVGRALTALEDELCGLLVGGDYVGATRSPDRADALVWGLTELMLGPGGRAAVRGL